MDLIKIIAAEYLDGYRIHLKFNDGTNKIVDLKDELWGEVFKPLRDIHYFKKFSLNPFTIEWGNGADFAPEFLYAFGEAETYKASSPEHI